jgi:hypothetical protein
MINLLYQRQRVSVLPARVRSPASTPAGNSSYYTVIVWMTCSSCAQPRRLQISLNHVQASLYKCRSKTSDISQPRASLLYRCSPTCALGCTCEFVCVVVWVSAWVEILQLVLEELRLKKNFCINIFFGNSAGEQLLRLYFTFWSLMILLAVLRHVACHWKIRQNGPSCRSCNTMLFNYNTTITIPTYNL